ncbi:MULTISPECIES: siderophore-interacting protein [Agrobacterium tumefaciens complex]|uniref:siderophore-interacting protein n=1 Tax=Agrobacterium tumefaciens complex TaxID=1183400 RepID=UPI000DD590BD|nr:siderophore-interacting protein [Agrobacterium tumefaciens]MDP9856462.1 NADPH-dependent ferric siderophore reductase [Agrobacterium tumefaciens]
MSMPETIGSAAPDRTPKRHRHAVALRALNVTRVEKLSRSMVRIVLTGPELQGFVSLGFDDHVKMFFAQPGETEPSLPVIGPNGIEFPEGAPRPLARDYTPRSFDAEKGELAIDFATHHDGPASNWAKAAKVGDKAWIAGPRGSFTVPFTYDWHLLIADDTGLPALARRLEEMPEGARVVALIEVETDADRLELTTKADASIVWVTQKMENGTDYDALAGALRKLELPKGDFFSWVACESKTAKEVRALLVEEFGANPKWTRASGYWRRGASGVHDHFDE